MQRRQVLIVDGYNVIRNNGRYAHLGVDYESGEGWNRAREALINDAAQLAQEHYERCTVVFDAAGNPESTGTPTRKAGIDVIFSPAGVSADSVIERLAHDAREKGFEVVVVSSDFTIQSTVFGGGVASLSALAFTEDTVVVEDERRDIARRAANEKRTIADRLDIETRAKLEAIVRGAGK